MKQKPPRAASLRYPGYSIVTAGCMSQRTIVGAIFAYGVFFDALYAEFGWSRALISGGSSLASLVMGNVIDRVGGRIALLYCYAIMLVSFVLLRFAGTAPCSFSLR